MGAEVSLFRFSDEGNEEGLYAVKAEQTFVTCEMHFDSVPQSFEYESDLPMVVTARFVCSERFGGHLELSILLPPGTDPVLT